MQIVQVARNAMATRFEIVLHGTNATALRAAGEEALDEIARLEGQLSLYRASSEIARVNARAAFEPVRVTPAVFKLLQHARDLSNECDGAFDITIAPLMRCWGFMGGTGQPADPKQVAEARECIGMAHVHFGDNTIRFDRQGVMIDLGAIGKGYAIDRAVDFLREAGVESALIHGGTSTVYGIGRPMDNEAWKVAVADAFGRPAADSANLPTMTLRDEALSVSAIWGRSFEKDGKTLGHVIDPRTGEPSQGAVLAAVISKSAADSDALSTALLVLGRDGESRIQQAFPAIRTFIL
ncbi:MAG: FAD:protein FMN transferase [Limisphaerales bacterium]